MATIQTRAKKAREKVHKDANVAQVALIKREEEQIKTLNHARKLLVVASAQESKRQGVKVLQMFDDHEKEDERRFRDTHKAIGEIYDIIPEHIATSIEKTVNGKIDKQTNNILWLIRGMLGLYGLLGASIVALLTNVHL